MIVYIAFDYKKNTNEEESGAGDPPIFWPGYT